jgi:putative CocE/NonD family hydrolase
MELPRKAAKQGYIVFLVDVRGRYSSEGEFEAYRTEKLDGYDVIEWIALSEHCNGKVGTYGISYRGYDQWLAMTQNPPHLLAAAPANTPINTHDFFYSGGAFSTAWLDWFIPSIFAEKRKRAKDTSGPWDSVTAREEWNKEDKRKWYLYRPLYDLPILKKYGPEYYEWMKHPEQDSWWDFASVENDFDKIHAPTFLISGWYDAAYGPEGATQGFNKMKTEAATEGARKNTKLILGPWNHTYLNPGKTTFGIMNFGPAAALDYDAELLHWFDELLKGVPNQSTLKPNARRRGLKTRSPRSIAASRPGPTAWNSTFTSPKTASPACITTRCSIAPPAQGGR